MQFPLHAEVPDSRGYNMRAVSEYMYVLYCTLQFCNCKKCTCFVVELRRTEPSDIVVIHKVDHRIMILKISEALI